MLDLEKAKVSDLRAKCRTVRRGSARQANPLLGITHYSKLSKADLQQLILACTSDKPPAFGHPISVVSPGSAQGIQAEHEFTLTLNQCQTSDNKYSSNSVNPSKGKKSQIAAVLPPKPYCSTDTTSKRPNTIVSREHPNVTLRRPSPTRQQKRRRISIPTVHRSEPQTQLPDASCEPHQAVVDLATKAGRTEWIKSLFIERIFAMLDKNRSLPLIQHGMHFRGVDPLFFESDCSIEAFLTAVRFCIARVHCFMALGAGQGWSSAAFSELGLDFVKWPIVNRVQRLNGQFWLIETTGANTKRYLCLGLTGEVLGMSGAQSGAAVIEDVYAREDWVRFIGRQRDTSEPLHCLIKTKDPHANPGGISRGWREKSNDLEVEIAKRVVLTSCYLNRQALPQVVLISVLPGRNFPSPRWTTLHWVDPQYGRTREWVNWTFTYRSE